MTALPLLATMNLAQRAEVERRPRAARRLGLVHIAAPKKAEEQQEVVEEKLAFRVEEIARRPAAARRLGLVESAPPGTLLDENAKLVSQKAVTDLAAGSIEAERRPIAASRYTPKPPSTPCPVPIVDLPLHQTAAHQHEVSRRPRFARRSGHVTITATTVLTKAVAEASSRSIAHTSFGDLDASRRRKVFSRVRSNTATSVAVAPEIPLTDLSFYDLEARRRPRAMARLLRLHDSDISTTHPELADGQELHYLGSSLAAAADNLDNNRAMQLESEDLVKNVASVLDKLSHSTSQQNLAQPNPFGALERMLEENINSTGSPLGAMGEGRVRGGKNSSSRRGSGHGAGSRGGSLKGASSAIYSLGGGAGGGGTSKPSSRGGSLRDGAGYSSAMHGPAGAGGSFNNLKKCGSQQDVTKTTTASPVRVNAGSISFADRIPVMESYVGVSCGLENDAVVCRDESNNVVVLSCQTDVQTGATKCCVGNGGDDARCFDV